MISLTACTHCLGKIHHVIGSGILLMDKWAKVEIPLLSKLLCVCLGLILFFILFSGSPDHLLQSTAVKYMNKQLLQLWETRQMILLWFAWFEDTDETMPATIVCFIFQENSLIVNIWERRNTFTIYMYIVVTHRQDWKDIPITVTVSRLLFKLEIN